MTDKDTGEPIEGVEVRLIYDFYETKVKETRTDKNGFFTFDAPRVNESYDVQCKKKGYIASLPDYYSKYFDPKYVNEIPTSFYLEEGKIKHLKIELEKGGTLKGTIYKKEISGISPFSDISFSLKRKKRDDEYFFFESKKVLTIAYVEEVGDDGSFLIDGLEPGDDYVIDFSDYGYRLPVVEKIKVNKGETTNFDYTIDLTNQTGIKGTITINGEPPQYGLIEITSLEPGVRLDTICSCSVSRAGEYQCLGLLPGKYNMMVDVETNNPERIEIRKFVVVEIKEGETKILNLDF